MFKTFVSLLTEQASRMNFRPENEPVTVIPFVRKVALNIMGTLENCDKIAYKFYIICLKVCTGNGENYIMKSLVICTLYRIL